MKRALITASVASMIDQFNIPNIELLIREGYQVDVACNFQKGNSCSPEKINNLKSKLKALGVNMYQIDFGRDVKRIGSHVKAFRELRDLFCRNHYDLVHCHSPIGGLLTRLAARKYRSGGTKIVYTAHGFHFYKGAPLQNWLIFYPIERICSRWTDILITINQEDFCRAKKKMHAGTVEYIPGIGVATDRFSEEPARDKVLSLQKELDLTTGKKILLSVGELNRNKNHSAVITALSEMKDRAEYVYLIVGQGNCRGDLLRLAEEKGVEVRLPGFRSDIRDIYHLADLYIHPSFREGLPVSVVEAKAAGCRIIASNIRGCRDVIDDRYLFDPGEPATIRDRIVRVMSADRYETDIPVDKFSVGNVLECTKEIVL